MKMQTEHTRQTTHLNAHHALPLGKLLAGQRTMTVTRSAATRVKLAVEVAVAKMCSVLILLQVSL